MVLAVIHRKLSLLMLSTLLLAACGGPTLVQPPVAPAPLPPVETMPPPAVKPQAETPPPGPEIGTIRDLPMPESTPLEIPTAPALPPDEQIEPRPGCRLAADPIACEKRHRASELALAECQGIDPQRKGDCMRDAMVRNEDCSRSRAVALCEQRKYAYDTCRGTYTKERRQCLIDAMPLDDCTKAKVQSAIDRCEASKKAMDVCKVFDDGIERRTCLYQELKPFLEEQQKKEQEKAAGR
jgi:hypothetical protein